MGPTFILPQESYAVVKSTKAIERGRSMAALFEDSQGEIRLKKNQAALDFKGGKILGKPSGRIPKIFSNTRESSPVVETRRKTPQKSYLPSIETPGFVAKKSIDILDKIRQPSVDRAPVGDGPIEEILLRQPFRLPPIRIIHQELLPGRVLEAWWDGDA